MDRQRTWLNNRIAAVFVCLLFLLGFFSVGAPEVHASTDQMSDKVIRVGFPLQGGLAQKDEHGEYSGYTYDYLQEIAQYTGWEYEFVEVPGEINDSLNKMMDMLSKGDIDILGGVVKNEYTQKLWDFAEYGYGFNYTTLGTLEENTGITENNYQGMKGLRIAVYKSAATTNEKLKSFCQVNNIDYVLVECDDQAGLNDALRQGRADVMIGNDLTPVPGIRIIAQFNGSQYYFATQKGNSEILKELNRTILTIQQVKPYFETKLYDRYFSSRSDRLYFSDEEQNYLKTSPVLRLAVVENHAPIQYLDKAGNPKGILIDLLKRIETETGIRFELLAAKDYEDGFRLLDEKQADAICGIPYDYKLAQKHDMIMSNPVFSAQRVLVTNDDDRGTSEPNQIGRLNRMQVETENSHSQEILFDSAQAGMDALVSRQVNSVSLNLYTAENLTRMRKYRKTLVIPQSEASDEYCIGIRKPVNPMLVSIIGKVSAGVAQGDLESIIYQNTAYSEENVSLIDFVEKNPFLSMGFVSVLFALFGIGGLLFFRFRMKATRMMAVENQRYRTLSELANEFIFEYDCKKDVITFSKAFSQLFSVPDRVSGFLGIVEGKNKDEDFLNPDILHIFKELMVNKAEDGTEFSCRLFDGEQRWYRSTWGKITDGDGNVVYFIGKLTDVQEERAEKQRLEHQLLLDGLTGIYNAKASRSIIGERLETLSQQGALLIMDIDCFKEVNDQLGHYTGDLVLKDFAKMLKAMAGQWDVPGRLGGDEFILFIQSCEDLAQLTSFCQKLCESARKTYRNHEGNHTRISISVGAALVREQKDFTELYQAVDKRLYESKVQGRDRFTIMAEE